MNETKDADVGSVELPGAELKPSELVVPQFISEAVEEIQRLTKFGRMVDLGFMLGKSLSTITDLYHARLKGVPETEDGLATLRSLAEELEPYATIEVENGLSYLKALLTIRYVTILETVVQDAVLFSLEHVSAVQDREPVKQIKGPVVELLAASPAERAEFLAAALAQETKASLKPGVGKFEVLLDAIGLGGPVEPSVRRAILELVQVRNVLVHRNGRADKRFCRECPWLKLNPGNQVYVTSPMTQRYRSAVVYYLLQILSRWIKRDGLAVDTSALQAVSANALEQLHAAEGPAG